jgi:ATP-dependent Clp protease ATP-binding subunit ClpC
MAETRYSERAQATLERAVTASEGMHHNYVGQEHLLLALAEDEAGPAGRLFATVGADGSRIRETVRIVIGDGDAKPGDARAYTPRMAEALAFAAKEAEEAGQEEVDTGHLVIGLLDEGRGIGAGILERLGLTAGAGRAALREFSGDD